MAQHLQGSFDGRAIVLEKPPANVAPGTSVELLLLSAAGKPVGGLEPVPAALPPRPPPRGPTVLVVERDAPKNFSQTLGAALTDLGFQVVGAAASGTDMICRALDLRPEIVLFDIQLADLDGLDALHVISQSHACAAVALTDKDDPGLLERAITDGVQALLYRPVDPRQLKAAVTFAQARFAELQTLQQDNAALRQTLQDRKIIERAKGELMKRYGWSEPDAFRRLQRTAMCRRIPLVDLANKVLSGEEIQLDRSTERPSRGERPSRPNR
jgi:response regulator NasT